MAGNAYVIGRVAVRADGAEFQLGTGDIPVTVTLTSSGGIDPRRFDILTTATSTLWDASTSPAGSFKFLGLLSDTDVMLEFQGTATADNGHLKLAAGIPFFLGSDGTLAYNAASFTGAAQVLKKILAKNSTLTTALVQVLICE